MVVLNSGFARAFHPASIAIVGVSGAETTRRLFMPYSGFSTLSNLLDLEFEGRIYPVNPNASEILGIRAYQSISSLPEIPDLVIIALPARLTPQALADCAAAGALNVHIMSSGFGETAQPEGVKLQEDLRRISLENGIRLIGPNCMGIHVPSARMSTFEIRPQHSGTVAFVSQSGSILHSLMMLARSPAIGFSKMISCGNSAAIDIADYIEFLSTDDETGIIGAYIEGVNDGRKLLETARRTNPVKPVIIWKAGLSDSGSRAAMSHTGLLSGEHHTWDSFFRQTGAVRVRSIEEMADMLTTFLYLRPPRRNSAAVVTVGGGNTVAAGDICTESGLNTPALSKETRDRLIKIISLVNQGVANPLDLPDTLFQFDLLKEVFAILAADPNIEILVLNRTTIGLSFPEYADKFVSFIRDISVNHIKGKPLVIADEPTISGTSTMSAAQTGNTIDSVPQKYIQQLTQAGIPVYSSLPRACRALAGFAGYHKYINAKN